MSFSSFLDLAAELEGLERPARYLGSETGAAVGASPDERGFILRIALAFPEVYEIAHSHLGHKILYHIFNATPGFAAERVYAPWPDYEERLKSLNSPLKSLESRAPLRDFQVVGFSLQYELSYTNILSMLTLGRVPLLAKDRPDSDPLIVAGGPGAANPEPLADFIDIFFVGEAEDAIIGDFTIIKDWSRDKAPKKELFDRLAGRPGLYIPSLFAPTYQGRLFIGLNPLKDGYETVPKATVASLTGAPFPVCQITPWVKPVHDRVAVEIARGCVRGCRFCQAGYLYRPVRERDQTEILTLIERNLKATGYDEAAFLSLSAGDHTQIESLVGTFMNHWAAKGVSLSLPSLRVKSLSKNLAAQIVRARKTGFTIAPEAATARLRAIINKDLTDDDLFAACEAAFSSGWRTLKLYFMAGLPQETEEDLLAIFNLAQKIKKMARVQLNVAVATFIPKPHTPFQWSAGSTLEATLNRYDLLTTQKNKRNLDLRYSSAQAAIIETVLARGDRRLGPVLAAVYQAGARFEAWNENLRPDLWFKALQDHNLVIEELTAAKDPSLPLPWERLGPFTERDFLLKELAKAERGEATFDCRFSGCQGCGACQVTPTRLAARLNVPQDLALPELEPQSLVGLNLDPQSLDGLNPKPLSFSPPPSEALATPEEILPNSDLASNPDPASFAASFKDDSPLASLSTSLDPLTVKAPKTPQSSFSPSPKNKAPELGTSARILLEFEKTGPMTLLGQLEMVEVFKKAFRRASLPVAYSQGFHPQPRLSFLTAPPLGQESLSEILIVTLTEYRKASEVARALTLPIGLKIKKAQFLPANSPKLKVTSISYQIEAETYVFDSKPLHPAALLRYTDNKGRLKEYDLTLFVTALKVFTPNRLDLTLRLTPTGSPKPVAAVRALFGLPDEVKLVARKITTNLT
ncbi:MAG: TIGR03960 family B12-binding radical SAM protein [Deltaproteobacteria bacterium]|nr:TIGR03960 family B12-binding radical SAM protein [Deltaproteobacteria bacterium]